ncbi:STAS domain-containing protein (plasmid) [Streptosporangium sp. CA-135522]|uniref:STAS domain-containing protein n=1 Tax=Streptosporangium sp. CA-135522 TaxID=3240072 RepID=UPI003D905B52
MSAQLSVAVTDYPGFSVLALDGELDASSAPLLRQVLADTLARGQVRLVVDAAKLTFCDSVGVWTLAEAHQCAVALGGRLTLAYVHGVLQRILEINQHAGVFPIGVAFDTTLEW